MKKIYSSLLLLGLCLVPSATFADPVSDAIAKPGRMDADLVRDVQSRPDAILPLLQLQPGDRVADIWAGGGYYSELIANIVGDSGEVLLVNNIAYSQFAAKGLAKRQDGRELGSVTIHTREVEDLELGQGSLDAALIIMSYHDTYHVDEGNGWRAIEADDFFGQIHAALKPKGRFLIVDHYATAGSGKASAQELHRIDVDFAKSDIGSRGFTLVAESDILRNPDDEYDIGVFDPKVRGKTDRFVLVFEKN
jgi:predicted methyltransferase